LLTRRINPAANAAGDVMGDLLCEGRGVGAVIEPAIPSGAFGLFHRRQAGRALKCSIPEGTQNAERKKDA
jgi:hypothetical protein